MQQKCHLLAAGSNSGGQLGLNHDVDSHTLQPCKTVDGGSFPPDGYKVVDLSSGATHTVALLYSTISDDVQIWATGSAKEGQLGKRLNTSITAFQQLDIKLDLGLHSFSKVRESDQWRPILVKCGWDSTFVALRNLSDDTQDDVLLVMGRNNDFGQLGMGQTKVLQDDASQISLPLGGTKPTPIRICAIACGLRHTLVLTSHDRSGNEQMTFKLFGWGAGRHGQLGFKAAVHWEPILIDEWKSTGTGSLILEAGKEHTIYHDEGRVDDADLKYLGSNRQGEQLVCNKINGRIQDAGCTWNATLILRNGEIVGSGNNTKGQLGQPDIYMRKIAPTFPSHMSHFGEEKPVIKHLASGSEHVLALCEARDGSYTRVWGWGWNEHGNLAQDDEKDRYQPVLVYPLKDEGIPRYRPRQIWAGCGTSFISVTIVEEQTIDPIAE